MKRIFKFVRVRIKSMTSYNAVSGKFGYRLYSKEFIDNSMKSN